MQATWSSRVAATICGADDTASRARGIAIWQFMNFVRCQPHVPQGAIAALLERIRRLVRLSDDRDLRQLPKAASGIDAVRLMTNGGPGTATTNLPFYLFQQVNNAFDIGGAAATGVVTVILTIIVATFALRMFARVFQFEEA